MELLNQLSLAVTLDRVNEALFMAERIPRREAQRVARWLAARQGKPRSYAEMFAPTDRDFAEGIRLFTGERISTGAGTAHILGEEACRALLLLDAGADEALACAEHAMDARLDTSEAESERRGVY